jgi:exopolysaccharide biosynthesis polyprenyl glycosylphosphotransferase
MKRSDLFFSLILVPLDLAMILGAFLLAYLLRFQVEVTALPYAQLLTLTEFVKIIVFLIPVWVAIFAFTGLYRIPVVGKRISAEAVKVFIASSASVLIAVIVLFGIREAQFSRLLLIYMWFFSFLLVYLMRVFMIYLQRSLYRRGVGLKKVILLKDGGELEGKLADRLSRPNNLGYTLVAEYQAKKLTKKKLIRIIKEKRPEIIIQTNADLPQKKAVSLMEVCLDYGVKFSFVPNLLGIIQTKTELADFFSAPLFIVHSSPLEGWGRVVKRLFDIISSLLAVILLSPFFVIIPILIKLTSPGPVFYGQSRIGRDGRQFLLYKFRSMVSDADQKATWTVKGDPRITPIGKLIRKTNLDEIPQFGNVLFGHMSLVGPRPERPQYVSQYSSSIPRYFSRHRVKSGITGWAQINGERGDRPIGPRVNYDMYYVNNWSLLFDLKITIITIWQLITLNIPGES